VADVKYRIELRQIDVKVLNARHYFWVMTRVDKDGKVTVLGELHGFPRDPETDEVRGFSMGGDNLGLVDPSGPRDYEASKRLPHVVAIEGSEEKITALWDVGRAAGEFVNKTRTEYDPLSDNSNAMATTIGKAMGLRPRKITKSLGPAGRRRGGPALHAGPWPRPGGGPARCAPQHVQ
jgi:hypothetical protein